MIKIKKIILIDKKEYTDLYGMCFCIEYSIFGKLEYEAIDIIHVAEWHKNELIKYGEIIAPETAESELEDLYFHDEKELKIIITKYLDSRYYEVRKDPVLN